MSCSGTQKYRCWNVTTFDGHLAGEKIRLAVLSAVESFPGFDEEVVRRYALEVRLATSSRADRLKAAQAALNEVGKQIDKVIELMLRVDDSSALEDKLMELEALKRDRTLTASEIEAEPTTEVELPSAEAIRRQLREVLSAVDFADPTAHRTLCEIVPSLVIRPCRLADGNALACRAEVTIRWVPPTVRAGEAVGELTHSCSVDLFDAPQRAAHRAEVVALRATGLNQREVGRRLGLTQPAVQNAIYLDRTMREKGLEDAYELLTEPPTSKKFKRQNHTRFRFDPLPGFPVWTGERGSVAPAVAVVCEDAADRE